MMTNEASFYDSSLVAVVPHGKDISLSFENVYVDGTLRFAELVLEEVIAISSDDSPIETLEIIHHHGDVLELSTNDETLTMLVEWVDYKKDLSTPHAYRVTCKSIVSKIGSVSPDDPVNASLIL
jgi:hypothetical protein